MLGSTIGVMGFALSADGKTLLENAAFSPPGDLLPPDAARAHLLYVALCHPDFWPSEEMMYCARQLKQVLGAPPNTQFVSRIMVAAICASCEQKLLPGALEATAYGIGGRVAIVALAAASPGRRKEFHNRLRKLPSRELESVFAVVAAC